MVARGNTARQIDVCVCVCVCACARAQLASMANYIEREVTRRAFVVERWNFREKEKMEHEVEAKKRALVRILLCLLYRVS